MIRSDMIHMDNMTALAVDAATANSATIAPVRDLNEVLDQIVIDATANAAEYLKETKVPYGGE